MSLAAIDQAATQPQPGTRLPARFSVAQFDAMFDAGLFSAETDRQIQLLNGEIVIIVHLDPAEGRYRSVQTFGEHELIHSKSVADVSLSVSRLFRKGPAQK